jgi:hypothetical protein
MEFFSMPPKTFSSFLTKFKIEFCFLTTLLLLLLDHLPPLLLELLTPQRAQLLAHPHQLLAEMLDYFTQLNSLEFSC